MATEWHRRVKDEHNIVARIDMRKSADIRVAYQESKKFGEGWDRIFGKHKRDPGRKSSTARRAG